MTTEGLNALPMCPAELEALRGWFHSLEEITPFSADPKRAARVAAYGISREIGGPNDEIARFLFDRKTGSPIDRARVRAELVDWKGYSGVRLIDSAGWDVRVRGFADFRHPKMKDIVIFPELVARVLEKRGIEPVLVRRWGLNSIFGGFDPSKNYYQANMWELAQNDGLLYAKIVARGGLALLGTHDLVGHVAGSTREAWSELTVLAGRVHDDLSEMFDGGETGNVPTLLLSYMIGTIFDDLAQPANHASPAHLTALAIFLKATREYRGHSHEASSLNVFPRSFDDVIQAARRAVPTRDPSGIARLAQAFLKDLRPMKTGDATSEYTR